MENKKVSVNPAVKSANKQVRWGLVCAVIGVFIFGVIVIIGGYWWFLGKQARVLSGAARATFPYRDYSEAELNKMYPQTINENVATTRTPEETHALFVAALKKGDFDEAVNCCFRSGDREKTKAFLMGVKEKGMLDMMIGDITRDFQKDMLLDTMATYVFNGTGKNGEKNMAGTLHFVKSSDGVWYLESLE